MASSPEHLTHLASGDHGAGLRVGGLDIRSGGRQVGRTHQAMQHLAHLPTAPKNDGVRLVINGHEITGFAEVEDA